MLTALIIISALASSGLPIWWFWHKVPNFTRETLTPALRNTGGWKWLVIGVMTGVLMYGLNLTRELLFPIAQSDPALATVRLPTAVWLFLGCLFAPVAEEILCRGLLLTAYAHLNRDWAGMWSAAVFALAHLGNMPPETYLAGNMFQFFAIFGIAMNILVIQSDSLWPAIFAHATHNVLVLLPLMLE